MTFNENDKISNELFQLIKPNLDPSNIINDHYPTVPELTSRMLTDDMPDIYESLYHEKHFAMAFGENDDFSGTNDESGKENEFDLKGKTILIVEDDYANFLYLKRSLKRYNPNVLRARNGKEAIEIAVENNGISLILMDMKMPVMNGYEATPQIKKILPTTPVIAQTAYVMEKDKKNAFEAGCDDILEKPITRDMLLNMMKRYLR